MDSNFQDDVKMIIFFVGLDQFNEPSRQNHAVDGVTHAMAEFLELLEEKSLCSLPILLVLNRHDVFCKKVQSIPPWEYVPKVPATKVQPRGRRKPWTLTMMNLRARGMTY